MSNSRERCPHCGHPQVVRELRLFPQDIAPVRASPCCPPTRSSRRTSGSSLWHVHRQRSDQRVGECVRGAGGAAERGYPLRLRRRGDTCVALCHRQQCFVAPLRAVIPRRWAASSGVARDLWEFVFYVFFLGQVVSFCCPDKLSSYATISIRPERPLETSGTHQFLRLRKCDPIRGRSISFQTHNSLEVMCFSGMLLMLWL